MTRDGNGARSTKGRGRTHDSVLDIVGDTPCIRVNALGPDGIELHVKLETFNLAGSVKDRLAVSILGRSCSMPRFRRGREELRGRSTARVQQLPAQFKS